MGRLDGKVAVVTGGSSGFGRKIAIAMAEEGAKIVIADLKQEPNEDGFQEENKATDEVINDSNGKAIFVKSDVTQADDMKHVVEKTVDTFGQLDVFVNNAGVFRGGDRIHNLTEEDLDVALEVNVKGVWHSTQQAVKQFLKQETGGKFVNIVSSAGLGPYPAQAPYNISKAAAASLTESVALEYGENNITANGICPTYVPTSLSREYYENDELRENIIEKIPLGRWGGASEVADLAVFLASDESDYINGVMIPLDGGETLSSFSNKDFGSIL